MEKDSTYIVQQIKAKEGTSRKMKTEIAALSGKSSVENPHVRFDEWEVASYPPIVGSLEGVATRGAKPRRGSLLYKGLLTLMMAAFFGCPLFATTWYVNGTSGSDSYSGMSSTQAKKTIQTAIDVASDGDMIRVAAGVYAPIVTDNKWLTIIGNGAAKTTIDGMNEKRCVTVKPENGDAEGVYTNTVIIGFLLVNGNGYESEGGCLNGGIANQCIIKNGYARSGGGASESFLENCLVLENQALNGGGADKSVCKNCTIVNNNSTHNGAACFSSAIENCILYGNDGMSVEYAVTSWFTGLVKTYGQSRVCVYTDNPHFVDAANGDYHLAVGSPCIDAGDNSYVVSETDLDGKARIVNGKVDIGCYEFQGGQVSSQYTVTFNANGGSCSTSSKQYTSGATLGTLPTATRSGYTFDGWYTSSSGGSKVSSSTTVSGNVTYYAHWTQNVTYYTVTFNANGGSCSTSSKQYTSGATLGTLPTATRSGYTFVGWYTEDGVIQMSASDKVTKNMALYAHWQKSGNVRPLDDYGYSYSSATEMLECIYEGNGGRMPVLLVPNGASGSSLLAYVPFTWDDTELHYVVLPGSKFSRSGYEFDGWEVSDGCHTYYQNKFAPGDVISIGCSVKLVAMWRKGATPQTYTVTFNANGGSCSTSSKQYTSGATLGTLPTATRSGYTFDGWYTSSSGGTKVSSSTKVTGNATYYAHWKAASDKVYVSVAVDSECVGMGTVSGGNKLFKIGAKVSITAKAAKGYVFAGWEEPMTVSGDYRKASDSIIVEEETEIYAYFVPKSEDSYIDIEIPNEWVVEKDGVDGNYAECYFWVDSYSYPTVTVKGLPSGCKYDKVNSSLVFAKQPSKPGVSKVTITAKNASGAKCERVIYVKVPNLRSDVFEYLHYDTDYHATCGVSDACFEMCDFEVKPGWTVKASGLPSGLKFDSAETRIYGTPTKAGTYTVTFTATKKGYAAQKATITFVIDSLPNEAVGKFNGLLYAFGEDCCGTFTMTATAAGKLSATLVTTDGKKRSYTAKSWNCGYDGFFEAYFYKAAAKGSCAEDGEWINIRLDTDVAWDEYQIWGEFVIDRCFYGGEGEISAQRNPFGKVGKNYEHPEAHSIAAQLAGFGKMQAYVSYDPNEYMYYLACPNCTDMQYWAKPDLTFTAKADGTVKVAGKLQGKSISGSSTLRIIGCEYPFADFYLIVNKKPVYIHASFHLGNGANGAVTGFAEVGD